MVPARAGHWRYSVPRPDDHGWDNLVVSVLSLFVTPGSRLTLPSYGFEGAACMDFMRTLTLLLLFPCYNSLIAVQVS